MIRLALLGFPSVEEIVRKVVDLLFGALSEALLPDFLRDGTVQAIKWLIAVPNPADAKLWPNLAELEGNMAALGFGLLGLTFVIAAVRYTLTGLAAGPHPLVALSHAIAAAAGIVVYEWAFVNTVALVNVVTNQILSWRVVAEGLGRTVKVLFGSSLLVGSGGVFLSLLALVAIFFAVSLFVMKIAVLMVAAILYVAGPAVIALYPLPEAARFTRLWLYAAIAVVLVPLGWCVIFATAGAISLDVTSVGELGGQGSATVVGAKTAGAFAGLLTFALAAMWPFKLGRHLGGIPAMTGLGARSGASGPSTIASARVTSAQARLRAGLLATGGVAARAAGAAGAPRGGLVGAASRGGASVYQRAVTGTGRPAGIGASNRHTGSAAQPTAASSASSTSTGAARATAPRGLRQRANAALGVVRDGPADVRSAVAKATRSGRTVRRGRDVTGRTGPATTRPDPPITAAGAPPGETNQHVAPPVAPAAKQPRAAGPRASTAPETSATMRHAGPSQPAAHVPVVRVAPRQPDSPTGGRLPAAAPRRSRKRRKPLDR